MSGEAISFFNNFKDLPIRKSTDKSLQTKVSTNDNDNNKKIELFSNSIEPEKKQERLKRREFIDFFSDIDKLKHVQEHVVELGRLVEKYEKNPQEAINDEHVKVKFSDEEKEELKKLLKDKNSLSAFFAMSNLEDLEGGDIIEGLKLFNSEKGNKKMPFANMTADEIAKMDPRQFAKELRKIRRLRRGMKSEAAVKIATAMIRNPHRCEHYEAIAKKRDIYSDKAVEKAVENMEEMSDDDALTYFENMNRLESIKDKKTQKPKYSGDVIVDVTKDTVTEPKAANAIFETAKREDMDGYHLKGISSNLVLNPSMIPSYERLLGAKDGSGDYKFGKETLLGQTKYMVDKSINEIEAYTNKVLEYAQHDEISGEDAASYAEKVMEDPSSESSIDKIVENAVSSGGKSNLFVSDESDSSDGVNSKNGVSSRFKLSYDELKEKIFENFEKMQEKKQEENNSKEVYYKKLAVQFRAKYGKAADTMIELCIKNPEVVKALFTNPNVTFANGMAIIKRYGGNVDLISAIAKNPDIVDKLHGASSSITSQQLTELAKLGDKKGVDFVVEILQKYGPRKAISICSIANSETSKENILNIVKKDKNNNISDIDEFYTTKNFIA